MKLAEPHMGSLYALQQKRPRIELFKGFQITRMTPQKGTDGREE